MPHRPLQLALLTALLHVAASASAQTIAWSRPIDVAIGQGERGPWRQNESLYRYVDDPTVAIDDNGEIVMAWADQARKDILLQRFDAQGSKILRQPVNVSRSSATFSWLPRIAYAHRTPQQIYMLWQEIIFSGGSHGGDILFARSEDGGRTFAAPLNLSRSVGGDGKGRVNAEVWDNGSLDLAAGPQGSLYAVWTEYHGPLWLARSNDGGRTFSPPTRVAGSNAKPARAPSLTLAEDGALYITWTVGEDNSADIHVTVSRDGGKTFIPPRVVERNKGYSDAPKLAFGSNSVLHLVYAQSEGGPFDRYHVRYSRSEDEANSFTSSRALSHQADHGASFPALSIDGQGNVFVLWELHPNHRDRSQGLALAYSKDGGITFSAPQKVPGSADPSGGFNGSQQGMLMKKLAVNHSGVLAIANSSFEKGEQSRIWLVRGEPLGR